jgi:hypothetical protein
MAVMSFVMEAMGITFFGFLAYRIAPADSSITRAAWDFRSSPRGEISIGWLVGSALGTRRAVGGAVEAEAETVPGLLCPPSIKSPAASVMKRTK